MGTTELATKVRQTETRDLRAMIEQSAKELARALPSHLRPERLVRIALTCIRQNPELARCTPESFLGALFVSAQLGIEPMAGQAYILPFNNSRKFLSPETGKEEWKTLKEAQFILGYKGLATLFYRHERAVLLAWGVRHERDFFEQEQGTDAFLKHRPAEGDRGPVLGYYVVAHLANGGKTFQYMAREACLEHGRKHSKTFDKKAGKFYDSSPWTTNEDAMCLKTALIQLAKLLPLSIELQRAIAADETSRDYRKGVGDALDLPPTTNWEEAPAVLAAPEAKQ